MSTISGFFDDFRFLSNFHPAPIVLDGVTWPTTEHAFQSAKTLDPEERDHIRMCETPGRAKRAGRNVTLRDDWDEIKIDVMLSVVRAKFTQHDELAERLGATGDAHLEEANRWGDTFWGTTEGEGTNHLGRILMQVRDELSTAH